MPVYELCLWYLIELHIYVLHSFPYKYYILRLKVT